ncbi:MAG: hypothetical protein HOL85_17015 [Rhodospirillaceae bacterium]|jgi:hypothetical protein|nr:hypothetical protein [Rhodospirillaceae bacterium]MBT6136692.1 hypothetical protein [Rhodospirillaceae bacterium]
MIDLVASASSGTIALGSARPGIQPPAQQDQQQQAASVAQSSAVQGAQSGVGASETGPGQSVVQPGDERQLSDNPRPSRTGENGAAGRGQNLDISV